MPAHGLHNQACVMSKEFRAEQHDDLSQAVPEDRCGGWRGVARDTGGERQRRQGIITLHSEPEASDAPPCLDDLPEFE